MYQIHIQIGQLITCTINVKPTKTFVYNDNGLVVYAHGSYKYQKMRDIAPHVRLIFLFLARVQMCSIYWQRIFLSHCKIKRHKAVDMTH
jgi:hypothetical protein